jgi:hypothetical protein
VFARRPRRDRPASSTYYQNGEHMFYLTHFTSLVNLAHLTQLTIFWFVTNLVKRFEPARLLLGWQAIRKARQEDVPAVMEASAKWQSPRRAKLR